MIKQGITPLANESFSDTVRPKKRAKKTRPVSIRFTDDELVVLRSRAGELPLGTFCRNELLGTNVDDGRCHRQPKVNQKELARILAALGQSRLSSNVNQLAKAVNLGVLDTSIDTEKQLQEASMAIIAMRDALIAALGFRTK